MVRASFSIGWTLLRGPDIGRCEDLTSCTDLRDETVVESGRFDSG